LCANLQCTFPVQVESDHIVTENASQLSDLLESLYDFPSNSKLIAFSDAKYASSSKPELFKILIILLLSNLDQLHVTPVGVTLLCSIMSIVKHKLIGLVTSSLNQVVISFVHYCCSFELHGVTCC
jgi:hypothetical protein